MINHQPQNTMSKTEDQKPSVAKLIPELMHRIGAIGKDQRNDHQRYNFRGIDDVLNHVGPHCADLGLRVETAVENYEQRIVEYEDQGRAKFRVHVSLLLRLRFYAPDGSCHTCEAVGESVDTQGDKATNKAMSAAFKYACFMGLVIPVSGALDESDHDDKQPDAPRQAQKPKPPKAEKGEPSDLRSRVAEHFAKHIDAKWFEIPWPDVSEKHKGQTIGDVAVAAEVGDLQKLREYCEKQAIGADSVKKLDLALNEAHTNLDQTDTEPEGGDE